MSQTLSVPSKTFLLGEYLALTAGPSLVLTTEPRFHLTITQGPTELNKIEKDSPAGQFYENHKNILLNYSISFDDPHQGQGGFGCSSAQFLLLYYYVKYYLEKTAIKAETLLNDYREYAWNGTGYAPSGADLLAQWLGHITYVDKENMRFTPLSWPFIELDFMLFRTGNKIPTHHHLATLGELPSSDLLECMNCAIKAFENANSAHFCQAINQYAEILQSAHLVSTHSKQLSAQFSKLNGVLACKGCGALGADVILVIGKREQSPSIASWAKQNRIELVTFGQTVSEGLQ